MLLLFYFTGARRGEVFKLLWEDVNLNEGKIRLKDNKVKGGQARIRWVQINLAVIDALAWWKEARPCKVGNVFMQVQCETHMGEAFTQRKHFMKDLCKKAGVKHFGFHAIRHKAAAVTFSESGLDAAQLLMGHYRATTTDIYVKSAGLYNNQSSIQQALANNEIGQEAFTLLKSKIPQKR